MDDLIAEHAPNGVKFKLLGDIARFVRGNGMPKTDLVGEGVGAIHYGQIYTRYGTWATKTVSFVTPEKAAKLAKAHPGDIIITNTSENVEDVGKAVAWLGSEPIVTGGHATVIQHDLDAKYLAYWFQSESFSVQKRALATGTKVIDVSARQLAKVRLPVPPMEVQRHIVRILDQFTRLETELKAELDTRRRQYAYFRGALLGHADETRQIRLGDLIHGVSSGRNKVRIEGGRYPVYGSTGPIGTTDTPACSGDALLVARVGANAGRVNAVSGEYDVSDNTLIVSPKPDWDFRFAFHQLSQMNLNQYAVGGGQPLITGRTLKTLSIFVPPIDEQRQIASVLDKFDALVNDLNIGLPAELTARRKQYEYYRDKLLRFEEAAT